MDVDSGEMRNEDFGARDMSTVISGCYASWQARAARPPANLNGLCHFALSKHAFFPMSSDGRSLSIPCRNTPHSTEPDVLFLCSHSSLSRCLQSAHSPRTTIYTTPVPHIYRECKFENSAIPDVSALPSPTSYRHQTRALCVCMCWICFILHVAEMIAE